MDKRALQLYAAWAKNNLKSQIEVSLKALGINSKKDIKIARKVGDYTIIDGDSNSYPGDLKEKRDSIVKLVETDGYEQVIEEFAYTWFNRIVALRFMEVHDFLPHGFRVLSSRDGGVEPEIMKHLDLVKDELKLDLSAVEPLYAQGKLDEAYSYILFRQCRALSGILPMLFDKDQDYLELLLPKALLKGETFITKLMGIGEENFLNDVEVIGWLYQFYVADDRQAFRDAKVVTKDLIPTLTQVFTPDWIVRYMAENSIGRIWLESYPNSQLKSGMKYYVEDAKQEADIQKKIDEIKYKNVNPEDIRIIEPCCGSGHILVYVFDLLYKMYEERGYQNREIPTLILKNNLVGLEIDKRAAQLASFSLIMKARTLNSRFFSNNYYIKPAVYEILDSRELLKNNYEESLNEFHFLTTDEIKEIKWLVEKFRYAKTVGSLLKFEKKNYDLIECAIEKIKNNAVLNIFNSNFLSDGIRCLKNLLVQAKIMSAKYDVMITNPPYLGISKMEKEPKDYLIKNYPNSKSDMFAMFMEAPYVKNNGFIAIVNPDSWMFLVSFEQLRKKIIKEQSIVNMIHLGMGAFDATVQTTSFVIRNAAIGGNGVYFRLVGEKDKEAAFLTGGGIIMNISCYNSIPGNLMAYWISPKIIESFAKGQKVSDYFDARQGIATANNDLFLKLWFEVSKKSIGFNITDKIQAFYIGKKWFPYTKGGEFRKWYGNEDYVINWENDGKMIKDFDKAVVRNQEYYFFECISWSDISSAKISFKYKSKGHIFDAAGPALFAKDDKKINNYVFGILNSKIINVISRFMSPALHFSVGQVAEYPIIECTEEQINKNVDAYVKENVALSKKDWDSFETSWDFKKHPLI